MSADDVTELWWGKEILDPATDQCGILTGRVSPNERPYPGPCENCGHPVLTQESLTGGTELRSVTWLEHGDNGHGPHTACGAEYALHTPELCRRLRAASR